MGSYLGWLKYSQTIQIQRTTIFHEESHVTRWDTQDHSSSSVCLSLHGRKNNLNNWIKFGLSQMDISTSAFSTTPQFFFFTVRPTDYSVSDIILTPENLRQLFILTPGHLRQLFPHPRRLWQSTANGRRLASTLVFWNWDKRIMGYTTGIGKDSKLPLYPDTH